MALIDLTNQNIADTPEPVVMPADSEVKLRVIEAKYREEEGKNNGLPFMMVRFEVVGEPLAKEVSKFFGMPDNRLEPKKNEGNKRAMKHFGEAFGVDFNRPFEDEDLVGLEGWVILGVDNTNEQYGEQNYIKRFVTGA